MVFNSREYYSWREHASSVHLGHALAMSFKALRNLGKLAAGQQDVEEIWADRHSVVNSWPLVIDLPKLHDLLLRK